MFDLDPYADSSMDEVRVFETGVRYLAPDWKGNTMSQRADVALGFLYCNSKRPIQQVAGIDLRFVVHTHPEIPPPKSAQDRYLVISKTNPSHPQVEYLRAQQIHDDRTRKASLDPSGAGYHVFETTWQDERERTRVTGLEVTFKLMPGQGYFDISIKNPHQARMPDLYYIQLQLLKRTELGIHPPQLPTLPPPEFDIYISEGRPGRMLLTAIPEAKQKASRALGFLKLQGQWKRKEPSEPCARTYHIRENFPNFNALLNLKGQDLGLTYALKTQQGRHLGEEVVYLNRPRPTGSDGGD